MNKGFSIWGWGLSLLLLLGSGLFLYAQVSVQNGRGIAVSLPTSIKDAAADLCPICYSSTKRIVRNLRRSELTSVSFYLVFVLLLALERAFPADKSQRIFSRELKQDFLWFLLSVSVFGILLHEYQLLTHGFFYTYLSFMQIHAMGALPVAAQLVIVFLVSDFLHWLHHLLRHKIRILWCFHTVHHSQSAMNIMTDRRVHPIEPIVAHTIRFIPFLSLEPTAAFPTALGWLLFTDWYTRMYHGNIRSNFGILRYVLVTPQSHRIHHSIEERHRDKNFGVIFSVWDHLFGTQYRDYDEYPATGITDKNFPTERPDVSVFVTLVKQLAYPFQLAGRLITGKTR